MTSPLVRELYTEETLNKVLNKSKTSLQVPESIDEALEQVGVNKKVLIRTVKKGMEEYVDNLVDLKYKWNAKMIDGNPEERKKIYDELYATIKRMDNYSEPYIGAMRLISDIVLKQLSRTVTSSVDSEDIRQNAKKALSYKGIRYIFDEQNVVATENGKSPTDVVRKKVISVKDAYSQITRNFMRLKDSLNLIEDTTNPKVYEKVRNTNEFPETRVGMCFGAAHEIDETMKQIIEGYKFLSKNTNLPEIEKRRIDETLKLLRDLDRGKFTRLTQWYTELQFHEKLWSLINKTSLASTLVSVGAAMYSLYAVLEGAPTTYDIGLLLTSSISSILSGAIYISTEPGSKIVKSLRNLDEKFITYKWV